MSLLQALSSRENVMKRENMFVEQAGEIKKLRAAQHEYLVNLRLLEGVMNVSAAQ